MIVDVADRYRMWLLITGTGRCGTGYVDKALTACGVECTHERVFKLDGLEQAKRHIRLRQKYPEWGRQAESSWLAAPFLDDPMLDNMTVVQVVRHPRNVIRSFLRMEFWTSDRYTGWHAFVHKHLPGAFAWKEPEMIGAYFWTRWNERIRQRADILHRIEDPVRVLLDNLRIEWEGPQLYGNRMWNTYSYVDEPPFELWHLPGNLLDAVLEEMAYYDYEPDVHERTYYELKGLTHD